MIMKKKIGTIIDSKLLWDLKVRAAQENRPMNEIRERIYE